VPTVDADLATTLSGGTSADGVPLGNLGVVIVDTSGAAATYVLRSEKRF
jgi:hypothetical protein